MSGSLVPIARAIHFVGFALALGSSMAAWFAHRKAMSETSHEKSGLEVAAASAITMLELPGLFLAMFAGMVLVMAMPTVLSPSQSGAGPWLHIKLTLVLGLLVASHLRMFRSRRLTRERKSGASEADCEALASKARALGLVDVMLHVVIVAIASLRFVLFGGSA